LLVRVVLSTLGGNDASDEVQRTLGWAMLGLCLPFGPSVAECGYSLIHYGMEVERLLESMGVEVPPEMLGEAAQLALAGSAVPLDVVSPEPVVEATEPVHAHAQGAPLPPADNASAEERIAYSEEMKAFNAARKEG